MRVVLCSLDTVVGLPIGLWVSWRGFDVFKVVLPRKPCKLFTRKLGAVISSELVW